MKKYLVTLFSLEELAEIRDSYQNWNLDLMCDVHKNLELYVSLWRSSVDLIYIFAKILQKEGEFWGITTPDIFVTKDWIYYYNITTCGFEKFESGSDVFFLRTQGVERTFLTFLKLYAQTAFSIRFHFSSVCQNSYIGTKLFWMYWWCVSGTIQHIPASIVPLVFPWFNPSLFMKFLLFYKKISHKIILKVDWYSWGRNIFILDLHDSKDRNNFSWIIEQFEDLGKSKIICMELIDTTDFEIRLLWVKKESEVEIICMYKKNRLPGQILHNISQGNEVQAVCVDEVPSWLIDATKKFCSSLVDKHWWLDILVAKDWSFYFTENNVLTWYLDTSIEEPFLQAWLDAIAQVHSA